MAECSRNLSGLHVYAQRGTRAGGWFKCSCGARVDRVAYERRQIRAETHRLLGCPCRGSLEGCDYYELQNRLEWAKRRIGYAENVLSRERWALEDAMRRYRAAEGALHDRERERDELAAELLTHQRESAAS